MSDTNQVGVRSSDDGITMRLFRPEDAPGVASLMREVYGEAYPIRYVYEPAELTAAFHERRTVPVIAIAPDGRLVGYMALFRSCPNPGTYEIGTGVVAASCRGSGINKAMIACALESREIQDWLAYQVIFGEAVCNHVFMQKASQHFRFVETAIEVDLMPAAAYVQEGSAAGRVASLAMFRTYRKTPHRVFLPTVYESFLQQAYDGFDDERNFDRASTSAPKGNATSRLTFERFDFANAARISVTEIGSDFPEVLEEAIRQPENRPAHLTQVWLKLTDPAVGFATEKLREREYFVGGALPRWFNSGDGLLMQKIAGPPNWAGIQLLTDKAKSMLEHIHRDWEAVSKRR